MESERVREMDSVSGRGKTGWLAPGFLVAGIAVLCLAVPSGMAAEVAPETAPPAGRASELTVDALSVVKVRTRVVSNARTMRSLGTQREGTGVVIDSEGLVLTIGYLIVEAETVELSTADGRAFPATVVGYDNTTGFGLLKALRPLPIKPVQFGQSATVAEREMVLIVGFDGVAPAYVVSRRPFIGYWEYLLDEAIYTAPATVNWSGAALLNREGKLLGIGSLVVGDSMGTRSQVPGNMFVPIDLVKPLLGDLIATGKPSGRPRPWIGINSQEVQGNVIVTRVSPEGPAEEANVRTGDVIVAINGQGVQGQADFYIKLWKSGDAGVDIPLEVLRSGKVEKITVKSIDRDKYYRPKSVY
jgi:serine protease Do